MGFFLTPWIILVVGWAIHVLVDRTPARRTGGRILELAMLWFMVFFVGAWSIFAGLAHIGPGSESSALSIGYTPSMFQWEVGWADIGLGVLGVGCAWKSHRGGWLTAAVVLVTIMYWGDAIGHIMQYTAHDNRAPNNVFAIPGDILEPLVAIILLVAYRRWQRTSAAAEPDPATPLAK